MFGRHLKISDGLSLLQTAVVVNRVESINKLHTIREWSAASEAIIRNQFVWTKCQELLVFVLISGDL